MRPRRFPSLALGAILATAPPAVLAANQAPGFRPPMRSGESVRIGGDISRYEGLYGTPEFRGIDDEMTRPWPRLANIRTVAVLAEIPGRGQGSSGDGYIGRPIEYQSQYTSHMLCGERHCIGIVPVEEMIELFSQQLPSWLHQKVEVVGAIDRVDRPTDPFPIWAFKLWSVQLYTESGPRRKPPGGSTLEALVTSPEATAGRAITVSGTFRGANLFEDLPPETRRDPGDWVLKDGPFSIWVTGRPARGYGWSLDPRSSSDCTWRLEVKGKVETQGGYVYLRAKSVMLIGRARGEVAGP